MKHVFEIKDLIATKESAEHIMNNQIDVLLKTIDDIDIAGINVFVNDIDTQYYTKDYSKYPVKFIPTLYKGKKKAEKHSFAALHNFVVNTISSCMNSTDLIIHIQDGTIDLTDHDAEFNKYKTRVGEMINDVVYMMRLLNHPVWFNTATDKGNMKFGHYYTNIDLINIDDTNRLESFPECIMYSGNSNLDWIMIDIENYKKMKMPNLMMNGEYDYDFLSIKQLIAKFVNFELGYFDTMFPTIPTEVGAYQRNANFDKDLTNYDMSKYNENVKRYQENLKAYKNLKSASLNDVILFVKNAVLPKLTESDKIKIKQFQNTLV